MSLQLPPLTLPLLCMAVIVASVSSSHAQVAAGGKSVTAIQTSTTADKSAYTLFNPTPAALMRDFSTDRPDKTESPYTVDAGHFQVETDLLNFTQDRENGIRTRTWNITPVNFKVGLLNNVDLQAVFDSYIHEQVKNRAAGTTKTTSGVGDLTARLKINFWGNDGGPTAFGIMPFVKIPTNSHHLRNQSVEGGVILPLAVELPGGWGMGVMTEVDILRNKADTGYHGSFINSVTFGHDIGGGLAGYVEFFSKVSAEHGPGWVGTVDVGLTYALAANIQLDAGCNFGVTREADDVQPFVGLSVRF